MEAAGRQEYCSRSHIVELKSEESCSREDLSVDIAAARHTNSCMLRSNSMATMSDASEADHLASSRNSSTSNLSGMSRNSSMLSVSTLGDPPELQSLGALIDRQCPFLIRKAASTNNIRKLKPLESRNRAPAGAPAGANKQSTEKQASQEVEELERRRKLRIWLMKSGLLPPTAVAEEAQMEGLSASAEEDENNEQIRSGTAGTPKMSYAHSKSWTCALPQQTTCEFS